MRIWRRVDGDSLRSVCVVLLVALAGCAPGVPNPTPAKVDAVLAGRSVEDLRPISSVERAYFLEAMRWCDWRQDPIRAPGPEFMFEIQQPEGRSVLVLGNGTKFLVGASHCELPASTASRIRKMARPTSR